MKAKGETTEWEKKIMEIPPLRMRIQFPRTTRICFGCGPKFCSWMGLGSLWVAVCCMMFECVAGLTFLFWIQEHGTALVPLVPGTQLVLSARSLRHGETELRSGLEEVGLKKMLQAGASLGEARRVESEEC